MFLDIWFGQLQGDFASNYSKGKNKSIGKREGNQYRLAIKQCKQSKICIGQQEWCCGRAFFQRVLGWRQSRRIMAPWYLTLQKFPWGGVGRRVFFLQKQRVQITRMCASHRVGILLSLNSHPAVITHITLLGNSSKKRPLPPRKEIDRLCV